METEAPAGEDAQLLTEQFPMNLPPFQEVPRLRFEWQKGVLAFEIRAAADFRDVALDAFAQCRQALGLFLAEPFEEGGAGDDVQGYSLVEAPRPSGVEMLAVEQAQIE